VSRPEPAPEPWDVIAQNLPEHARNRIHTDEGARAAGFPAALVAGVTTYAYLTHPIVAMWGLDWVRGGGGEVRFRGPVHRGDVITCLPMRDHDVVAVEARVLGSDRARAVLRAWPESVPEPPARPGDRLATRHVRLEGEFGSSYGSRAGDDLDVYEKARVVHPAVWPALANHVVHAELARGPWIHTRSRIWHHAMAPAGSWAGVHATVVDRFRRSGERVVLEVIIEVDGRVVATLEHEAIVELEGRDVDAGRAD